MIRRTALLVLALAALLAAAPVAQADDESVYEAWTAEASTHSKLEQALGKNLKTWSSSNGKKGGPALERIAKIRALIARRKKGVTAEEASTSAGSSGRKNALAQLRDYDAAMVKLRSAINAGMAGKASLANSYVKQYDSLIARSKKYRERALDAFADAGVA